MLMNCVITTTLMLLGYCIGSYIGYRLALYKCDREAAKARSIRYPWEKAKHGSDTTGS